ncbi:MAG: SBBP repeat-containing protein, partial [Methanotrichaceae archaeon]|nr:SBBP repeat-containing protein [Methanotrichaceae archaeon]
MRKNRRMGIALVFMIILTTLSGSALVGYSFQPTNALNSNESNNTQINKESVRAATIKLPLSFIDNRGQVSDETKFMVKTSSATIYFTSSEILFALPSENNTSIVRMSFEGANPGQLVSEEPLPGKANFFIGNNSSKWVTEIPTYGSVKYENLYPGVDLVFKGIDGNLKHEMVLKPGADPAKIVLAYSGQDNLSLAEDGSVLIRTATGNLTDSAPVCYQEINGSRVTVEGQYRLIKSQRIGFEIGIYDRRYPLVIDPALVYSTYLGGSGYDHSRGIAVDSSGNAYVIGSTDSTNFPMQNPIQPSFGDGLNDVFVTKINAAGSALIYSSYLGGNGYDYGYDIAVDSSGNAFVTGSTQSINFPTQTPIQPSFGGGSNDGFVAKINAAGSALVYSTYIGGNSSDYGEGIAVDSSGNVYITGRTDSTNFPMQNPIQPSFGGGPWDVFVTKINAAGLALVYSTYLGRSDNDYGNGIAVDSSGNVYIVGTTYSTNFPTQNPIQPSFGGGEGDGFVTKINADGSALVYSTYLGGSSSDHGGGIAVDSSGKAYVTGTTYSTNFPTQNPIQP